MKSVLMVLIMLPLVCLVVSVILYLINRSRYKELISDFQQKHTLPPPLLVALQYGIYRFTSNGLFFHAIKTKQKNLIFKQER